jgi:hypothetical protein
MIHNMYKFQIPFNTMDDAYLICVLMVFLAAIILMIYFQNKKIKYWAGITGSSFWTKQLNVNQNLAKKQRIYFAFLLCASLFIFLCIVYIITHEITAIFAGLFGGLIGGIFTLYTKYKKTKIVQSE